MEKKIIGVISGKGGVGKTSLTASLACIAEKDLDLNVLAIDCDVDAPNLAIILPAKNGTQIELKDVYTSLKASFFEDKCVNCKLCIEDHFCEFNALQWDTQNSVPIVNYLSCEGCGSCKVLCPEQAFEISPVKSGTIISYLSDIEVPLIFGETQLGSTTSGKLVSEAKEHAKSMEAYEESNLIIIDGPPGIGCPVIATIAGLDYVITITEPTPSGLHDVIRAIEVVNQFNIPFGIIINKYDLKSSFQEEFQEYIKKTGFTILGRIPFDLSIPEAMSFAEAVVEFDPKSKASQAIKDIYWNLKDELWRN